jgi:hypothetical protein
MEMYEMVQAGHCIGVIERQTHLEALAYGRFFQNAAGAIDWVQDITVLEDGPTNIAMFVRKDDPDRELAQKLSYWINALISDGRCDRLYREGLGRPELAAWSATHRLFPDSQSTSTVNPLTLSQLAGLITMVLIALLIAIVSRILECCSSSSGSDLVAVEDIEAIVVSVTCDLLSRRGLSPEQDKDRQKTAEILEGLSPGRTTDPPDTTTEAEDTKGATLLHHWALLAELLFEEWLASAQLRDLMHVPVTCFIQQEFELWDLATDWRADAYSISLVDRHSAAALASSSSTATAANANATAEVPYGLLQIQLERLRAVLLHWHRKYVMYQELHAAKRRGKLANKNASKKKNYGVIIAPM